MAPGSTLNPPSAATSHRPQPLSFSTSASDLPADLAAAAAAVSAAMGRLVEGAAPAQRVESRDAAASPGGAAAAPSPWAGSAAPEAAQAGGFRLSLSELSASEEAAATGLHGVRCLILSSLLLASHLLTVHSACGL